MYFKAGLVIWKRRQDLSGFLNPLNENPFASTVTTEVHVTSDPSDETELHPYSVAVDATAGAEDKEPGSLPAILRVRSITREAAEDSVNPEAWLYARVAFLFYLALLVTWVCCPTSARRPRKVLTRMTGSIECKSPLHNPLPAKRKFWSELRRLLRLSSARFLECHRLHSHIADRVS